MDDLGAKNNTEHLLRDAETFYWNGKQRTYEQRIEQTS